MAQILIVDDEIYIRELIRKALNTHGHSVIEAENGHEALKSLHEHKIDIVIIDLVMPQKGGLETLMEIRDYNPELKIIIISGKIETSSDSIQMLATQFNVEAVLAKPFDIDEMLKTVGGLL